MGGGGVGGGGIGGGGGNDGGVIATKRDMIKVRAEDKGAPARERERSALACTECAMSGEPLAAPILVDELGHLLNKEAVLRHLIAAKSVTSAGDGSAWAHLRSLKRDCVQLKPHFSAARADGGPRRLICPLTRTEANGSNAFVALRACGCVISEAALRAGTSTGSSVPASCPACDATLAPPGAAGFIRLFLNEPDISIARAALYARPAAGGGGGDKKRRVEDGSGCPGTVLAGSSHSSKRARTDALAVSANSTAATAAASSVSVQMPPSSRGGGGGSTLSGGGAALAITAAAAATTAVAAHKAGSVVYASLFHKPAAVPAAGCRPSTRQ